MEALSFLGLGSPEDPPHLITDSLDTVPIEHLDLHHKDAFSYEPAYVDDDGIQVYEISFRLRDGDYTPVAFADGEEEALTKSIDLLTRLLNHTYRGHWTHLFA